MDRPLDASALDTLAISTEPPSRNDQQRRQIVIDLAPSRREQAWRDTLPVLSRRAGARLAVSMGALWLALMAFVIFGPFPPLQALVDALAVLGVVALALLLVAPQLRTRRRSAAS
jgi:uncharacterized RDD family membrane protein YckC